MTTAIAVAIYLAGAAALLAFIVSIPLGVVLEHRERMARIRADEALIDTGGLYPLELVELAVTGALTLQGLELEHAEAVAHAVAENLSDGSLHDGRCWRDVDDVIARMPA